MTIKQDWKNWRNSCEKTKQLQDKLEKYIAQITKQCDKAQYFDNYSKKLTFGDLIKISNKVDIDKQAIECRASSCFYKLKSQSDLHDKCVHVRHDCTLDKHCIGCPQQSEMNNCVDLQKKVEVAQVAQYNFRDAFLQHFVFWKKTRKK